MSYVQNGNIVKKKPFFLVDWVYSLINIFHVFFSTLFTTQSTSSHIQQFNATKGYKGRFGGGGGGSSSGSKVTGFAKAASSGCTGGG